MPEYSSTTITPADGVKTPAMEGSTSGNYTLAALRAFILASKGLANGLASLDANGKLLTSQLPDLADDVLVYGSYALLPSPGTAGKLYITADDNKMYRWDADLATPAYVELSVDLSAYATKAELAVEESAREAADTDLKNALQATNARVENLEQEHGGYYDVDVKSPYTIPSGKAKNWSVNVLRGVTRGKNQQFNNASLHAASGSATISGGVVTFNGNAIVDENPMFSTISGHIYLFAYSCKNGISGTTDVANYHEASATRIHTIPASSGYQQNAFLFTSNGTTDTINFRVSNYSSGTMEIDDDIILTDLTTYFNGTIPSDAQTIAQIQTNYPELLVPSAYGSSLVSTRYEGVKSVGVNLWDEVAGSGGMLSGAMNSKNPIPVLPLTDYYFGYFGSNAQVSSFYVKFLDANGNLCSGYVASGNSIGGINTKITSPADASTMMFRMQSYYGTTYLHDIQIALDSSSAKTTYHPYMTDTLSLPSPVTLRSAGSVADEFDLESGVKTRNIGSVDLGTLTYTKTGSNRFRAVISDKKDGLSPMLCANYQYTEGDGFDVADKCISNSSSSSYLKQIFIYDSAYASYTTEQFKSAMSGVILYYALATPTTEQLDPIQNPFLATEAGGTISSILTDAVDDSMTLGYINL